ncbi:ABC transporter substrate-binding protein [Paenibacillus sepulcri]|uniref:Extracellular solute-binding protein n=1 Tax=Paenibacillus sepulcri TaxID=359917 RepID=A0ABS7C1N1_9BACL|nr:extracellular solute-binding protein [Paenibacillus sepulcri]
MKKIISIALLTVMTIMGAAACTEENGAEVNKANIVNEVSQETAETSANELTIFTAWPAFYVNEDIYEKQVGQYIKAKFPDVTFKHIAWNDGTRYEDLIAKGTIPDIVFDEVGRNTYRQIRRFKMEYDMTDLVKKYNFDTGTLNPADFQHSVNTSDGKLYSLPFNSNDWVLVYNKDIFDQFGLDYPKDGMTWDEAYEMTKKLTRQVGDITYKGFQMNPAHYMRFNQLSEPALNPNEDKSSMVSDNWLKIVSNIRAFYEIPGNQLVKTNEFVTGKIAMIVDSLENVNKLLDENKDLNFDISSVPVFPDAPKSKFQPDTNGMFITNQSADKDLAFQVIQYLLSPEYQTELSRQGVISPLADPAVQEAYGKDVPGWEGKHLQSIFYLNGAMPPARKPNLTYIYANTDMVWKLISTESKDNQTALRMADEAMNKAIEETIVIHKEGGISPHE